MYPLLSSTLDMFSVCGQDALECVHDGEGNFQLHHLIKPTKMHYSLQCPHPTEVPRRICKEILR
jgi:hypothetical protein